MEDPGPPPAFDVELLMAQAAWVRSVARHLVRDPAGAEDVAQETLLAALQSPPHDAEDPRRLRAWLGRVAYNLAHLDTRRRIRRRDREERVARVESQHSTAETFVRGSLLAEVTQAVDELEEPYKSAVHARYFEGKSTQEIADESRTTDNAVRKRLWRAREKLRQNLDRRHNGDRLAWFNGLAPLVLPILGRPVPTVRPLTPAGVSWKALAATPLLAATAVGAIWLAQGTESPATGTQRVQEVASRGVRVALPVPEREASTSGAESAPRLLEEPDGRDAGKSSERAPVDRGAGSGDQGADTPAKVAEAVHGQVLLANDGGPLAGVSIVASGTETAGRTSAATAADGETGTEAEGGSGTPDPVQTDSRGAFEAPAPPPGQALVADAPGFVTLRSGSMARVADDDGSQAETEGAPAGRELLFVLSEAVEVSGTVLDDLGRPVPGAWVTADLPDDFYLEVGVPLDDTEESVPNASTDAAGRFSFVAPTGPGVLLHAHAVPGSGRVDATMAMPARDRDGIVLVCAPEPPALVELAGIVLFEDARPAPGALVSLGQFRTHSDARGEFHLRVTDDIDARATLRAFKSGYAPAELRGLGQRVAYRDLPGSRADLRLLLGKRLESVEGLLESITGPLIGYDVSGADRSQVARIDERGTESMPRIGKGRDGDSGDFSGDDDGGDVGLHSGDGGDGSGGPAAPGSDDGGLGDGSGRSVPPPSGGDDPGGATAGGLEDGPDVAGRTDLHGRFRIRGRKTVRPLVLQGFDPRTGTVFRSAPVLPGPGLQRVVVVPVEPRETFHGRLVDPDGRPFAHASVQVSVRLATPAGERRVAGTDLAFTDDDGRFVLHAVPARWGDVLVEHPDLGRVLTPLPDAPDGGDGALGAPSGGGTGADLSGTAADEAVFVLERLGALRVDARRVDGAASFRVLDADEEPLLLSGSHADGLAGRLFDGRSEVVQVSRDARTVVLLDAERRELARLPLVLADGDATPAVF